MFFGGLFAAYFNVRANAPAWPPINVETNEPFHLEILPLVGPATILLILSSWTCQLAVWAIRRDDRTAFLRNIGVTFVIGVVFLLSRRSTTSPSATRGYTFRRATSARLLHPCTGFHGRTRFGGAIMLAVVPLPRHGRPVLGSSITTPSSRVAVLAFRRRRVDPLFSLLYLLPGKA